MVANLEGWKRRGLRPFTSCVHWRLLAEVTAAALLTDDLLVTLPARL